MELIREKVKQEDWEFFDSLNIQYNHEHIIADKYATWVTDRNREIIFTCVDLGGRDYGETYVLIWQESRVYIYIEARSVWHKMDNVDKYHIDIQNITAPIVLKDKHDDLVQLIREVCMADRDPRSTAEFVIDNIAEPQFVEGK